MFSVEKSRTNHEQSRTNTVDNIKGMNKVFLNLDFLSCS